MICAMFQNLGRMLVTYYFFEESQEIARLVEQGQSEDQASIRILGLTCSEIGTGVARSWNFPKRLLAGMVKLPSGEPVKKPKTDEDQLLATVNMANELCVIAATTSAQEKSAALNRTAVPIPECSRFVGAQTERCAGKRFARVVAPGDDA